MDDVIEDVEDNFCYFELLPNEILLLIFKYLYPKQLTRCRQVCTRWKSIIDFLIGEEALWKRFCREDFYHIDVAECLKRSLNCDSWYEIYRSLTLWGRLHSARETFDEFCHCQCVADEIRDIVALENGLLAVHRRTRVSYFDLNTLAAIARREIDGDFVKYIETPEAIIAHSSHSNLYVMKWKRNNNAPQKVVYMDEDLELDAVMLKIKWFVYDNNNIFYVTNTDQLYKCSILEKGRPIYYRNLPFPGFIAMTTHNGKLYILTYDQYIYKLEGNEFVSEVQLEDVPNIIDCLWKRNFIECMDWRACTMWLAQRGQFVEGPLKFISRVRTYGDLFLVGCHCGILLAYYKPYTDGELDFFNIQPIKHFNFAERKDIPVLSMHPILNMCAVEIKNGHIILVALPRKIVTVKLTHDSVPQTSKALVPFVDPRAILLGI